MTMQPASDKGTALERARRAAEDALAGTTPPDPRVQAAGAQLKEELGDEPLPQPARMTRAMSYVLDDLVQIPGTRMRVGVDPLLSLVPWAGTAVGAVFGGVVLMDAIRLRAPIPVLARMVGNSIIDWLLGLIPFVGAVADMSYRSNRKNLKLLNRTIADRELVRKSSVTYWLTIGALVAVTLAIVIAIPVAILLGLDHLLTQR